VYVYEIKIMWNNIIAHVAIKVYNNGIGIE